MVSSWILSLAFSSTVVCSIVAVVKREKDWELSSDVYSQSVVVVEVVVVVIEREVVVRGEDEVVSISSSLSRG